MNSFKNHNALIKMQIFFVYPAVGRWCYATYCFINANYLFQVLSSVFHCFRQRTMQLIVKKLYLATRN